MVSLLSTLPIGTKIVDKSTINHSEPVIWVVASHDHYGSGGTALISDKLLTYDDFDFDGFTSYSSSEIRREINELNGPTHYYIKFSDKMQKKMKNMTLSVPTGTGTDPFVLETIVDKVTIPSVTELGLAPPSPSDGNSKTFQLFSKSPKSTLAYPSKGLATAQAPYEPSIKESSPFKYMCRSIVSKTLIRGVSGTSDNVTINLWADEYAGVRYVINLDSSVIVSDEIYKDALVILFDSSSTSKGNVSSPDALGNYIITDNSGVVINEYLNGVLLRQRTHQGGTVSYKIEVPLDKWNNIKFGKYRDSKGAMNSFSVGTTNGFSFLLSFTKVLKDSASSDEVFVATTDMVNTAMPSHKKKLVDAIGNKATVGGTGTLEDIAKAIESISVESLGGAKFAKGLTPGIQGRIPNMPPSLTGDKVKVTGLSFTPDLVIVTLESDTYSEKSPIIYRRKLKTLNDDFNVYSAEVYNATQAGVINEIQNGFELPTKVRGTTFRWIAFGFEDF